MKTTAMLLLLSLSGCAFVSKDIHPDLGYRQAPLVEIIEYDSWWALQKACFAEHKTLDIYTSCVWVPYNPAKACKIRMLRGREDTLQHDLQHCRGRKDTMNPFKIDYGFYSQRDKDRWK